MIFYSALIYYFPSMHHNQQVNSNWFSGSNALRVFAVYVALDLNQDGTNMSSAVLLLHVVI